MKKISFVVLIALLFVLQSCQVQVPISAEYLAKPSRVGLYINSTPAQKYKEGSQGLLDLAMTSGDRYKNMLEIADSKHNPKNKLVTMYTDILKVQGKEVVLIDEEFDMKEAPKFKGEKLKGKKYSNYDFRDLKNKYQVDEVLFVNLMWGAQISYYSMIETGRSGYAYFDTRIVNLNDNSLYLANDNVSLSPMKGKWKTPPNYEIAVAAINKALNEGIEKEMILFK